MTAIVATRDNFARDVLEASFARPVLVDFWAPWCGPCRALSPILDRVAADLADRVTLAKVNSDEEPDLAARYGVRGIPNCKLFVDGEVADEFTGALPESGVRAFLAAALPSPASASLATAGDALARGDVPAAMAALDEAVRLDPEGEDVQLARAEALLAAGRAAEARAALDALAGRDVTDERRLAQLRARTGFETDGGGTRDLASLAQRAAATPIDCAAKLAYARALAGAGDYEPALAELLAIVRHDRAFGDDVARRTMLSVFDALPPDSDLARRFRRELASALNR